MNWCIFIPLAVGAICALLGYLLGKLLKKEANSQVDVDVWKNKVARLEADLKACQASKEIIPFNAAEAAAIFGKKVKENDLTIIEGIGPKIAELFHDKNIVTWKALSECSVEKCQSVLDFGGERFKIHNPGTWPEQAKMAYEGHWKKLFDWQEELDGGR
ncbi:hypothetical protein C1T31_01795 [Hanstruepera neustonica]|uniref:LSU ribosomal protein L21p n=1 Tax=Hanstruepera neustonica TaxID=1445657 RepID=A0A2K1E3Q1_9FLAO|nr:hypothetical protein [Hanstruepera neustonica]PNQ74893.1 hypothetical protein C1T31_01795 [Hanstruepera neustonica]